MRHYPRLTEHGTLTRPHERSLNPTKPFFVYNDTGLFIGTVEAWDSEIAALMADRQFGPDGWSSLTNARPPHLAHVSGQ